jgi:cytochrome c-type biogenesis protein CcmF
MHAVCFVLLFACLVGGIYVAVTSALRLAAGDGVSLVVLERSQTVLAAVALLVSLVLVYALAIRDFSFVYVRDYTDTFLPLFYAVTAFWAGQDGSFLFWYAAVAVMGMVVARTEGYRSLSEPGKVLFWLFYLAVELFFLYALTGPSNPFLRLDPVPKQGNGLNPLLQNPGMIFHPPLLFLGYAAYTVPACMAVAGALAGDRGWLSAMRNWNLMAWSFLSAGIALGAWWAYMELGWGGYWAWDPVENASLIPWLAGTAFLHTAVAGRSGALARTNVFLAWITLLLCFFATFVVRSGMIESLHAFGGSRMGVPLLALLLLGLGWTVYVTMRTASGAPTDETIWNRPGMLFVAAWLLVGMAVVVLVGVNWPLLSRAWSASTQGLGADFYNRACLPLGAGLMVLMAVCPWFAQKSGIADRVGLGVVLCVGVLGAVGMFVAGYRHPLAVIGALGGFMTLACVVMVFVRRPQWLRSRTLLGAYGVHLGMGLIAVGVAFSAAYKTEVEVELARGGEAVLGEYRFVYEELLHDHEGPVERHTAQVRVWRDGRELGVVVPEKRLYPNFRQSFAEVSVIPSLGAEVYASLLGFDEAEKASFKFSIQPLVNWIWIGSTLACVAALLAMRRTRRS